MEELKNTYAEILDIVRAAESRKAKYQRDIEQHQQRKSELKTDQEAALQTGDSAAYLEASRAIQDEQIMIDFSTKKYDAEISGAAMDSEKLRALASKLHTETLAKYKEIAQRIVPVLFEAEKIANEAETLLRMHTEYAEMVRKLSKGTIDTTAALDNRTVCIAGAIKARRENIEQFFNILPPLIKEQ